MMLKHEKKDTDNLMPEEENKYPLAGSVLYFNTYPWTCEDCGRHNRGLVTWCICEWNMMWADDDPERYNPTKTTDDHG